MNKKLPFYFRWSVWFCAIMILVQNALAQTDSRTSATTITPTSTSQTITISNLNSATAATFIESKDYTTDSLPPYDYVQEPFSASDFTLKDQWLKFVATHSEYEFDLNLLSTASGSNGIVEIEIYRKSFTGDTMLKLISGSGSIGWSTYTTTNFGLPLTPYRTFIKGATYYIRLTTTSTTTFSFQLIHRAISPLVSNDEVNNATLLTVNSATPTFSNLTGVTYSINEKMVTSTMMTQNSIEDGTAWYKFVAPSSGAVMITNGVEPEYEDEINDSRLALYSHNGGSYTDYNNYTLINSCSRGSDEYYGFMKSRGMIIHTGLTPGQTYYIQAMVGSTYWGGYLGMKVEDLKTAHISQSYDCSMGYGMDYNSEYYSFIRTTSTLNIREDDIATSPIIANIQNNSGLNLHYIEAGAGYTSLSGTRTTSDGRLYSNNYFYFDNTAPDASGTYNITLYMKKSFLNLMGIIGSEFKITRVPGECISTITPALETSATDISITSMGTTTDGNGVWIKFSTTQLGTFFIRKNLPVSISSITQTNISCFGGSNGTASITAINGTPPYTYSWIGTTSSAPVATLLPAGTYTAIVTDALGFSDSQEVTITQPTALSYTSNVEDVSCHGSNDGAIMLIPSGGTSPYSYVWTTGETTNTRTGLSAGVYKYTITDVYGCQITDSIIIEQPEMFTVTKTRTHPSCIGTSDGSVTAIVSGGTPPYTYLWDNGETTSSISGLTEGIYLVTITDANGCIRVDTIMLWDPNLITATITHTDVSCYGATDGTATIILDEEFSDATLLWSNGETTPTANNLPIGEHFVTASSATGCSRTFDVIIDEPIAITQSVSLSACAGDSIEVNGNYYYSNPGSIVEIYASATGCDSTVTYTLTFNNDGVSLENTEITSYQLADTAYFTSPTCAAIATVQSLTDLGTITTQVSIDESLPTIELPFVARYFDIHTTNAGGGQVTLYFTADEFENYNTLVGTSNPNYPQIDATASNLMITAYHSLPGSGTAPGGYDSTTAEVLPCTAVWNNDELRWEVTFTTTSFSGFFLHTSADGTPLNMESINLVGNNVNNSNILKWSATNNQNAEYYVLQKSNDGRTYNSLGEFKMNNANQYGYQDRQINSPFSYYRIMQIDNSGKKNYSKILTMKNSLEAASVNIHPNPTSNTIQVDLNLVEKINTKLEIIDINGRILNSIEINETSATIDLSPLPQGVYYLQITNKYQNSTHKVVKK